MTSPEVSELLKLRESVELETRAVLFACACDFGNAAALMKQANAIRRRIFGRSDPNDLRELTEQALRARSDIMTVRGEGNE